MVFNGYKRPLEQEDMWELNEKDSTGYITHKFEEIMKEELWKARQRLQKKLAKKKKSTLKSDCEQNGLAKGVSQDILVM
ncbi:canalicular multispecific organic anion transporter 1, partial [Silurus meridionalis]